ncbi:MAG: hypothetical protein HUU20_08255 [Pirellulales bacterium]|nr:hypothetical protein [Pirellulales bacterium]
MARPLRCLIITAFAGRARVPCSALLAAAFCLGLAAPLGAQQPAVHYWHQGSMPPGAVAAMQLARGGPLPGHFQPVEIVAPPGVMISMAEGGAFGDPMAAPARVGLMIGPVYRIRVMNLPLYPGLEVFPTIEVIDRLYTPRGQETRFPVLIELTQEDLELALDGKFVTRVIYLEDPDKALAVAQIDKEQSWFEAGPGRDPLAIADQLGRPIAILRLGARLPNANEGTDPGFLCGSAPLLKFPPQAKLLGAPPAQPVPVAPEGAPPSDAVQPSQGPATDARMTALPWMRK